MPTIFFKFGFRFYFVSFDCSEPPHIHVGNDADKICKFWLREKVAVLADNSGFTKHELKKIEKEVNNNFELLINKFNEYCKGYKK
ncbi:MAG: hypothetical protein RL708_1705 [Bacteroidota bacterium]|jgi:hypothetical protein